MKLSFCVRLNIDFCRLGLRQWRETDLDVPNLAESKKQKNSWPVFEWHGRRYYAETEILDIQ